MNILDMLFLGFAVASLVFGTGKVIKSEMAPMTPGSLANLVMGFVFIIMAVVTIAATVLTPMGGGWELVGR